MKKQFCCFLFAVLLSPAAIFAEFNMDVLDAVRNAYNFKFAESGRLLEEFIKKNPENLDGYAGRIIYDFLIINQDPDEKNIETIISHLKDLEIRADEACKKNNSSENRFFQCFTDYYLMKSLALSQNWAGSFSHAAKARSVALELKKEIRNIPDLYFIIGEQDYSSSLAPGSFRPAMKLFDFNPERLESLSMIETAMEKGLLTRQEAKIYYISSCIYIEKKYQRALDITDEFLVEFPDNLSARFYKIDILLRMGELEKAEKLLEASASEPYLLKGKWAARNTQMKGNLYNAKGNYTEALKLYSVAVEAEKLSNYTYTEITLEMGKLYDILGNRKEARQWFWKCEKSSGLAIQKEEAKTLRQEGYKGSRGSY